MAKTSAEIMQMLVDNNVKLLICASLISKAKNSTFPYRFLLLMKTSLKKVTLSTVLPSLDGKALRPAICC